MNINQTSRIITHPSTVDTDQNHVVVLIDADDFDIENISLFCSASMKNFDIYLYYHDLYELEWLNEITKRASKVLINDLSKVSIQNCDKLTKFGHDQELKNPLNYFQNYDKEFQNTNGVQ
jgi:hypothetical protein